MFERGVVKDVIVKDLPKFVDDRGWFTGLFREDETDSRYLPVMAYVSMTHPGIAPGPHRLFVGKGKKDPVDEARYEADPNTIYIQD